MSGGARLPLVSGPAQSGRPGGNLSSRYHHGHKAQAGGQSSEHGRLRWGWGPSKTGPTAKPCTFHKGSPAVNERPGQWNSQDVVGCFLLALRTRVCTRVGVRVCACLCVRVCAWARAFLTARGCLSRPVTSHRVTRHPVWEENDGGSPGLRRPLGGGGAAVGVAQGPAC